MNLQKAIIDAAKNSHNVALLQSYRKDIVILVGRLYNEDPDTFAPETREVMDRWIPEFEKLLHGEVVNE